MPLPGFQPPDTLSYWEREVFFRHLDVVIVGSGLVGLSAAICLKERQPEWQVAVIERGVLPFGASTRNAGFACFGSMTELLDDLHNTSEDEVWALVERRWAGLQRLRARVGDARLEYETHGGYELFRPEDEVTFRDCHERLPAFNEAVAKITGTTDVFQVADAQIERFGFQQVQHLVVNQLEGQLHTGKMIAALLQIAAAKGVMLLNGIDIQHWESDQHGLRLHSARGWVLHARKMLVATNGFARQLLPELEMVPARNQVLITHPMPGLRIQGTFHYDRGYFYFRNVGNRLLLGGGRHLAMQTEQTDAFGTTPLIRGVLIDLLGKVILPDQVFEIDSWWSGILAIGMEKKPIVQEAAPNVYVAVRLGGMGVAIGSLVGEEAADLLLH